MRPTREGWGKKDSSCCYRSPRRFAQVPMKTLVKYCASCQTEYSLHLTEDGQFYCADCREACGYKTQVNLGARASCPLARERPGGGVAVRPARAGAGRMPAVPAVSWPVLAVTLPPIRARTSSLPIRCIPPREAGNHE